MSARLHYFASPLAASARLSTQAPMPAGSMSLWYRHPLRRPEAAEVVLMVVGAVLPLRPHWDLRPGRRDIRRDPVPGPA